MKRPRSVLFEIAELLVLSKSFISKWKNLFNLQGIEGLKLAYKGAKSYLTLIRKRRSYNLVTKTKILGFVRTRMLFN